MPSIIYLTLEQVLLVHEDQIARYGGSSGLRDLALIESALFRPQSSFSGEDFYKTIFDKAAALMHSIILNHAFVDGNKRTGTAAMLVFLELNGYRLYASQSVLVKAAVRVESKEWDIEQISSWIRKNSRKI